MVQAQDHRLKNTIELCGKSNMHSQHEWTIVEATRIPQVACVQKRAPPFEKFWLCPWEVCVNRIIRGNMCD